MTIAIRVPAAPMIAIPVAAAAALGPFTSHTV
jgi:hypothetical protein